MKKRVQPSLEGDQDLRRNDGLGKHEFDGKTLRKKVDSELFVI